MFVFLNNLIVLILRFYNLKIIKQLFKYLFLYLFISILAYGSDMKQFFKKNNLFYKMI